MALTYKEIQARRKKNNNEKTYDEIQRDRAGVSTPAISSDNNIDNMYHLYQRIGNKTYEQRKNSNQPSITPYNKVLGSNAMNRVAQQQIRNKQRQNLENDRYTQALRSYYNQKENLGANALNERFNFGNDKTALTGTESYAKKMYDEYIKYKNLEENKKNQAELTKQIKDTDSKISELNKKYEKQAINDTEIVSNGLGGHRYINADKTQNNEYLNELSALQDEKKTLQAELDKYKEYIDYSTEDDFSKYKFKGEADPNNAVRFFRTHNDEQANKQIDITQNGEVDTLHHETAYTGGGSNQSDRDFFRSITQEEADNYSYLLGKYGQDKADEYLQGLAKHTDVNNQYAELEKAREKGQKNILNASVESLGLGLATPFEAAKNIISGDEYRTIDDYALVNRQNYLRQGAADTITDVTGSKNVLPFAYNTAMSGLDNYLRYTVGSIFGGAAGSMGASEQLAGDIGKGAMRGMMAGQVMDQSMSEALNRGLSNKDAVTTALIAAFNEELFETISLEQLDAMKAADVNNLKDVFKNAGKQFVTEGSEEVFTDIGNAIADDLVNGDDSEIQQNIRQYLNEGKTMGEAKRKAATDFALQLVESGLSGGLTGVGMGAGVSANNLIDFRNSQKYEKLVDNYVSQGFSTNEARQMANEAYKNELAQNKGELLEGKTMFTGKALNKAIKATQKLADNVGKMESEANEYAELTQPVVAENATTDMSYEDMYNAYNNVNQAQFNDRQTESNQTDTFDKDISNYVSKLENLDNKQISKAESNIREATNFENDLFNFIKSAPKEDASASDWMKFTDKINKMAESYPEETDTIYDAANAIAKNNANDFLNNYFGENLNNIDFKAAEKGNEVKTEKPESIEYNAEINGQYAKIVDAKGDNITIEYQDGTTDTLNASDVNMSEGTQAAVDIAKTYGNKGSKLYLENMNSNVRAYTNSFNTFYNAGRNGTDFGDIQATNFRALSDDSNKALQMAYDIYYAGSADSGKNLNKGGLVRNENRHKIDERLARSLDDLGKAIGITIQLDGRISHDANGVYDDGRMHLSLDTDKPILVVFAHELTHRLAQTSPKTYKEYEKYVIDKLKEAGQYEGVLAKIKKKYANQGVELTNEVANEELAANATEMFLMDADFVEKFVDENRSLFDKVLDYIKQMIADIKKYIDTNYAAKSVEAQVISQNMDILNEARDLWTQAIKNQDKKLIAKENAKESRYNLKDMSDKQLEAEYDKAIKENNEELESKIVEQYAKNKGYTQKVYHGTQSFGFTKLDTSKSDDNLSFFTASSPELASTYSATTETKKISDYKVKSLDEVVEHIKRVNDLDNIRVFKRGDIKTRLQYLEDLYTEMVFDDSFSKFDKQDKDNINKKYDDFIDYLYEDNVDYDKALQLFKELDEAIPYNPYNMRITRAVWDLIDDDNINHDVIIGGDINGAKWNVFDYDDFISEKGNYEFYANLDNFMKINANNSYWNSIKYEGKYYTTRELAKIAKDKGYDGIQIDNVIDNGGRNVNYLYDNDIEAETIYNFFNPQEQLKSADPITYDDEGNVIPLSERFNKSNDDIRFSLKEDYGKGGYKGQSMSNRAVKAYEYGEKPLSKWTKTELLNSIDDILYDNDKSELLDYFKKLTVAELKDNFLYNSSWHHTGSFYNKTDFYQLNENNILNTTKEDIDNIISDRKPRTKLNAEEKAAKKTEKQIKTEAKDISVKLDAILKSDLYKVKTENALIKRLLNGKLDIDSAYKEALDILKNKEEQKVKAWEKLPENHYRYKQALEFRDNFEKYANKYLLEQSNSRKSLQSIQDYIRNNNTAKYSLKEDSEGRTLSKQQQEYFKDSKVVDENGNLLVMYHGTDAYKEFTIFKSGKSGYLGKGMYFSESKNYAERYAKQNGYEGRIYETYLNVKNPLIVTSENPAVEILGEKVAKKRELKNSFSTKWITPADIKKLQAKGYDGIIWKYGTSPIEVSVWDSNQIKNVDNLNPTDNPDIRFNLKEPVEETKDLIAVHNLSIPNLENALEKGGFPSPSIAIRKAKTGHNNFGKVSVVFYKDTIDPEKNKSNKVYNDDVFSPRYPTTLWKKTNVNKFIDKYKLEDKTINELNNMNEYLNDGDFNYYLSDNAPYYKLYYDKKLQSEFLRKNKIKDNLGIGFDRLLDVRNKKQDYQNYINNLSKELYESVVTNEIGMYNRAFPSEVKMTLPNNLENIVKIMNEEGKHSKQVTSKSTKDSYKRTRILQQLISKEFNNINEIKNNETKLEFDELKAQDLMNDITHTLDLLEDELTFNTLEDIAIGKALENSWNTIFNSFKLENFNKENVRKIFKDNGINFTDAYYKQMENLRKELEDAPKLLFEAKPQRVVGINEIAFVVLPSFAEGNKKLIDLLKENNISYNYYDFSAEDSDKERIKALNSRPDVRFSLKEDSEGRKLSEQQQEYFKDSKAVDDEGNLQVVYHGTNADFTIFDKSKIGQNFIDSIDGGFFFTDVEKSAKSYGSKIIKSYLNIKNPYELDYRGNDFFWNGAEIYDMKHTDILHNARFNENDGIIIHHDNGSLYVVFDSNQIKNIDNKTPTDNADIRFSLKEDSPITNNTIAEITSKNEFLADEIKNLEDMLTSGRMFFKANQRELFQVYDEIAKEYKINNYSKKQFADNMNILFEYIADVDNPDAVTTMTLATMIAYDMIDTAGIKDTWMQEEYDGLQDFIKATRFKIADQDKNDLDGGYDYFRKKYFGKLTLAKDGIAVNSKYMELNSMYPELFPENITHPAEQLMRIGEVMDMFDTVVDSVEGATKEASAFIIARDILDKTLLNNTRGKEFDTKEKLRFQEKLRKSNANLRRAKRDIKEEYEILLNKVKAIEGERKRLERANQRLENQMGRQLKQFADFETDEKLMKRAEKYAKENQKLREKFAKKQVQDLQRTYNKERKKQLDRIKKITNKLSNMALHPKKDQYIPSHLMNSILDVLQMIDLDSGRRTKDGQDTNISKKLKDLQESYKLMQEDSEYGIRQEYNETVDKSIGRLATITSGKRVNELYDNEISELADIMTVILHEVNNARKLINDEKNRDVRDISEKGIEQIRNANREYDKNQKFKNLANKYINDTLSPVRVFNRLENYALDGVMAERAKELVEGERKTKLIKYKAMQMLEELSQDKEAIEKFEEFRTKKLTYNVGGKQITITPDMRVALYLHSLNKQNMQHVSGFEYTNRDGTKYYRGGGVIIPNYNMQKKSQEKLDLDPKDKYTGVDAIRIVPSAVKKIIKDMTPYEKRIAELYREVNNYLTDEINKTSMELYGFKKARVENYFPLVVDKSLLQLTPETLKVDKTLESMGFLKERIESAQPIYLEGVMDALYRQIDKSSLFAGMAIPNRNFNKVYNYTVKEGNYRNNILKQSEKAFGKYIDEYYENLVQDFAQSREKSVSDISKVLSRGKMATGVLTGNLSVVIKQMASYPTAAGGVLEFQDLLKGLSKQGVDKKDLIDRINKYSPYYKDRDTSTIAGMNLNDLNTLQKKYPKLYYALTGWIEATDKATVRRLWYAAENYVKRTTDLEVGSDAFYETVANVWEDTLRRTQPIYDTMSRPEFLRQQGELTKWLMMFKTQAFQNIGILVDSFGEYQARKNDLNRLSELESKLAEYKKNYEHPSYSVNLQGLTKEEALAQKKEMQEANRKYWLPKIEETENEINQIKEGYPKAKYQFKKALASQLVQAMVFAAMTAIADAIKHRPDEWTDDKTGMFTAGSFFKKYLDTIISNTFSQLAYGDVFKDLIYGVYKNLKGEDNYRYDLNVMPIQVVNDTINNIQNIAKYNNKLFSLNKNDFTDNNAYRNAQKEYLKKIADTVSRIGMDGMQYGFGLPVKNIKNLTTGLYENADALIHGENPLNVSSDKQQYNRIYNAYKAGDTQLAQSLSTDIDDSKLKTNMVSRLKDEKDIKAAADYRYNGDTDAYQTVIDKYVNDGFDEKWVTSAINSDMNKKYGTSGSTTNSIYNSNDLERAIDISANQGSKIASQMYDDKVNEYIEEGQTTDDAKKKALSSIKSSITSKYKSRYENGTTHDKVVIRDTLTKIRVNGQQIYTYDDISKWN